MKNLAPDIMRQRLLVEGIYSIEFDEEKIRSFMIGLANKLKLRTYGEVLVHSPDGIGKSSNEGFDAFLPLIDSGISFYVWTGKNFFALVLFTCKEFNSDDALAFINNELLCENIEFSMF